MLVLKVHRAKQALKVLVLKDPRAKQVLKDPKAKRVPKVLALKDRKVVPVRRAVLARMRHLLCAAPAMGRKQQ